RKIWSARTFCSPTREFYPPLANLHRLTNRGTEESWTDSDPVIRFADRSSLKISCHATAQRKADMCRSKPAQRALDKLTRIAVRSAPAAEEAGRGTSCTFLGILTNSATYPC